MLNFLLNLTIYFYGRIYEINEPIKRVCHCSLERILHWNNTVISHATFDAMEHIIHRRGVNILTLTAESFNRRIVGVGFFWSKIRNCTHR